MRNLQTFKGDCKTVFSKIVGAKRNPRRITLNHLLVRVHACFDHYLRCPPPKLEGLTQGAFTEEEVEALLHCYENMTAPLEEMLNTIRSTQDLIVIATCQYCGISEPATEDHYIPKGLYPEFAAFGPNLIPCCHICNSNKGSVFLVAGVRAFINLYYDSIPHNQFLFASVTVAGSTPLVVFELRNDGSIPKDTYERIVSHYTRLRLLERYSAVANCVVSPLLQSMRQSGLRNRGEISKQLLEEATIKESFFGSNHWKPATIRGMANSITCIDLIALP